MDGINPVHASHKLNVIPSAKPVRQKVRHFHFDRLQVIQIEVDNLLKTRFIREIKYPEWLANEVVVLKKGGKWRVCMDYTNLNKACTKDNFPLPQIDQIVDALVGMGCYRSWMPSRDIIKYPCIRQTRKKQPSSPRTDCYATM